MPHISLPIGPNGPVLDFFVGASTPRQSALRRAGLPVPSPIRVKGLIDTGASCTSIDPTVLKSLGLVATGTIQVHTPSTSKGQPHLTNQFDISIILPHAKMNWQFHAVPVIEAELSHQGIQALLGRDILSKCLFTYDGQSAMFALAF
jgi:hypothetical protein